MIQRHDAPGVPTCLRILANQNQSVMLHGQHWMNMSRFLIAAGLIMVCCDVVLAKAPLVADLEPLRKFQVEPALTDEHSHTSIPVRLPPGRARLATRPSLTGSSPTTNTMGTVAVAALAATTAVLVGAAIARKRLVHGFKRD